MNKHDEIIKAIHRLYRQDKWLNAVYGAIGGSADSIQTEIDRISANYLILTADLATIEMHEKELAITPTATQTLDERRAAVKAKLRSDGTMTLSMLQNVCNAWKNGEVSASFADGRIKLTFVGEFGIPTDLGALRKALDEIKPAHLAIEYAFRYLLIKEVHDVMTLATLESQQLKKFAGGAL